MNIGVIGTGDIGAVIIRKLRHAGYAVCPSLGSNLELDSWSPRSLCHLSRRGGLYSTPDLTRLPASQLTYSLKLLYTPTPCYAKILRSGDTLQISSL
jgi:hypothetical protein